MTDRDAEQKMKMKTYADQKLGVKERHSSNQATKTQQTKPPVQSSTSRGLRKMDLWLRQAMGTKLSRGAHPCSKLPQVILGILKR